MSDPAGQLPQIGPIHAFEQPVITSVQATVVRANGAPIVRLVMAQQGAVMSCYLQPDEIDALAAQLKNTAQAARNQLIVPPGGANGLIMPGG